MWDLAGFTTTTATTVLRPLYRSTCINRHLQLEFSSTHTPIYTHTHTRLTALFPGLPRWAGTRKVKPIWILLKQETVSGSSISWAICKSASRSSQITIPAPHCSVFTGRMPFLPPNQQRQSTSFPTQKGKTSLDLNEARDDGVLGWSGISRTIHKQSAPRSTQITTPTPHNSIFTGRTLFLTPNQQHQSIVGKAAYRTHAKWWERETCVWRCGVLLMGWQLRRHVIMLVRRNQWQQDYDSHQQTGGQHQQKSLQAGPTTPKHLHTHQTLTYKVWLKSVLQSFLPIFPQRLII